jgi:hypothetical protein
MRYMMFIRHREDYRNQQIPPGLMEAMGEFVQTSFKNGTLIDTAGLQPTDKGKRVQLRAGKMTVVDGPFTESKEVIGGYAILEASSDAKALEIAKEFMELHRIHWPAFDGECEMRPLEAME